MRRHDCVERTGGHVVVPKNSFSSIIIRIGIRISIDICFSVSTRGSSDSTNGFSRSRGSKFR